MQNVDIIEIDDEKAHSAKLLASAMSKPLIRKRGLIDMLGIECAISYLNQRRLKIDTRKSVYKIPLLFEEFKISDIYYANYRIDVITLFKEKTVKIPKIHVDMDIMPDFYFVVQIGSKIKEAKMIGFIDSKNIPLSSHDSKFYYPTLDTLLDFNRFVSLTQRQIPPRTLLGRHTECMGLFLKFIDNDLSSIYKKQLIQHLMNCESCRKRFIDVMEFNRLADNIRFYPELMRKYSSKKNIQDDSISSRSYDDDERGLKESLERLEADEQQIETAPIVNQAPETPKVNTNINNINKRQLRNEILIQEENIQANNSAVIRNTVPKRPKIQPQPQPRPQSTRDVYLQQKSASQIRKEEIINSIKEENPKTNKKIINNIFDKKRKVELPSLKAIMSSKSKRMLLTTIAILFVFSSFVIISFGGMDNDIDNIQNAQEQDNPFEGEFLADETVPTGVAKLIPKERNIEEFNIERPQIAQTYAPAVSKISWEAPQSLVKKDSYAKYLQLIGKNIKLNLQNDLLLVNDVPMNKNVKIDIKVTSSGEVHSIDTSKSSGSPQIDAVIEKTVNETLKYMKPPSHGIIARPADITLTVEFH